jgi:hypothetical protein
MDWIKRNLFIVIGGVVTLLLLGAAGFYIYKGLSRNSDAATTLNGIYDQLNNIHQQKPAPGNEKINNIEIAKEQEAQLREWIASTEKYFQPVPSIPATGITGETFASALRRTLDALQHEAEEAGVTLPPKYDFSFSAERPLVRFADGSLEPLAAQLGEVKAIVETIFSGRVNAFDGIQRVRVSADDANGSQADYIDEHPVTNDLAVVTPYVVTFRCFTPELSRVVGAFAMSSNTFLIKAINVQPASAAPTPTAAMPMEMPGGMPGGMPGQPGMMPPGMLQPGMVAPAVPLPATVAGKGGLQTVLKEQLLRVSLEVGLVKLQPKR